MKKTTDRSPADSPTAWFVVLESARLRQDFERAAEAVRQLKRLGVTVRFSGGRGRKQVSNGTDKDVTNRA